ncbi:hypothetical protein KUH03_31235 [Sphingobacterium sp. E70]|nr:hypothetical protein [Sphingobacterium sp. E70]ULT23609.1 hypothetical protein KUH03_31235 [Sphingobacterium sp. E70]
MNGFLLRDAKLSKEDLKHLPQFSPSTDPGRISSIAWKIAGILFLTLAVWAIAAKMRPMEKKY